MLKEDQVIEIRILKEMGLNITEIARRLCCHPNTISKYLKKEWKPMSGGSKLDPYKDYLVQRLEEYPKLTAVVLFKEIVEKGYTGGISTLRMYLHQIRKKEIPEIIRFETSPGKQAQIDWGQGRTIIDGEETVIKFFVMVLGYSRMLYVEIVANEKLQTLINAHQNAFEFFKGAPLECLYDNMTTVVKKIQEQKEFNTKLKDFADFHGFKIITHRPYNPKAKGKIERMVPFVRNNILYGKTYSSFTELENALQDWLFVANSRLQSEFKETPLERFEKEKELLTPLNRPYPICRINTRKVRERGHIVYKERAYDIGHNYVGEQVGVLINKDQLKVYYKDNLVKVHPLKEQVEVRSLKEYEELLEGVGS